jgi:hypothetical protein
MTTQTHTQAHPSQGHKKKSAPKKNGAVSRVTKAAEKIHRSVAGLPLDVLEQIDSLKKPVARIRKLQERSIAATYDVVRAVNKEVAQLLRNDAKDRPAQRRRTRKTREVGRQTDQPMRPAAAAS